MVHSLLEQLTAIQKIKSMSFMELEGSPTRTQNPATDPDLSQKNSVLTFTLCISKKNANSNFLSRPRSPRGVVLLFTRHNSS